MHIIHIHLPGYMNNKLIKIEHYYITFYYISFKLPLLNSEALDSVLKL